MAKRRLAAWVRSLVSGGLSGIVVCTLAPKTLAQSNNIVSDNTLGVEQSGVVSLDIVGLPIDVIDGGAIRGQNLFHSFREFNVAASRGAYFRNPSNAIQNILARVTGANPSEILGTLGIFNATGVNSSPNLFLINPNGIIFGQNAVLDLPASFLATTAQAIQLGSQGFFSASAPESSNLLAVNPSALLFNQILQPATITNRSVFGLPAAGFYVNPGPQTLPSAILPDGSAIPLFPGLQVADGKTLALVGGDIFLDRGAITSVNGRIELGSVAGPGSVRLNLSENGFSLSYENAPSLGNIQLSSATVITNGETGGEIQIQTGRLFTNQNNVFSGISADIQDIGPTKGIFIRATDSINLDNASITAAIAPFARGIGNNITIQSPIFILNGENSSILTRNFSLIPESQAGDILIETDQLNLTNASAIIAGALGPGNGGNLTIKAAKSAEAAGDSILQDEVIAGGFQSDIRGTGRGGTVLIETPQFRLKDGAIVSARTDDGPGGSVIITARDSVELLIPLANVLQAI